jgi:hypothetical protein
VIGNTVKILFSVFPVFLQLNFNKMILQTTILMGLLLATNLEEQPSRTRQLFIFGKSGNQLLVQQQLQLFNKESPAVKERNVAIVVVEKI